MFVWTKFYYENQYLVILSENKIKNCCILKGVSVK